MKFRELLEKDTIEEDEPMGYFVFHKWSNLLDACHKKKYILETLMCH